MKLLNREPTEEMIKAACEHYTHDDYTGPTSTFRAMYDAAPEIHIDMEPIGRIDDLEEVLITLDDSVKTGDALYSATHRAIVRAAAEIGKMKGEK